MARSIYDNSLFFITDVIGTQTVANAVAKADDVKVFVHVSTSEVYGTALHEPMDEDHPLNPLSPYASAKAGADRLVYSYRGDLRHSGRHRAALQQLRSQPAPREGRAALRHERAGWAAPHRARRPGRAMRDWLYVDDTVRALSAVARPRARRGSCEVFNLGTGVAVSVLDIAERVCELTGRACETTIVHIGDRPGQVSKHVADATRFHAAIRLAAAGRLR